MRIFQWRRGRLPIGVMLALAMTGCVGFASEQTSDGPISRNDLACLSSVGLGDGRGPAPSPSAARCIKAFIGLQGADLGAEGTGALLRQGFRCSPEAARQQTCTFTFARKVTHKVNGSAVDGYEEHESVIKLVVEGSVVKAIFMTRTNVATNDPDGGKDVLVEESTNLLDQ